MRMGRRKKKEIHRHIYTDAHTLTRQEMRIEDMKKEAKRVNRIELNDLVGYNSIGSLYTLIMLNRKRTNNVSLILMCFLYITITTTTTIRLRFSITCRFCTLLYFVVVCRCFLFLFLLFFLFLVYSLKISMIIKRMKK